MKTHFFILINISVFLISTQLFASSIQGTKHDFSTSGWTGGEICIACHVPHNSSQTVTEAPLWNHSLTTNKYVPYTSDTLKAQPGQPDGVSKLCLSCHDGTVALDSISGNVGTVFITNPIYNTITPVTDSSGTTTQVFESHGHWAHPISFVYDTNLSTADTRLNDPSSAITSFGHTIQTDLLFKNKVQCTSCHDVHNKNNIPVLLRMPENNLCNTCHVAL